MDVNSLEGLTEEEITAVIDAEMAENALTEMERLRRANPTLNDAWNQIKTIKGLTQDDSQQRRIGDQPKWYQMYSDIVEGVETDNKALKDAWDQYFTLKQLLKK